MSERKYYCFCDANCKAETMTKEQILAAIAQAVETGSVGDCDTGFITKVKEMNGGDYVTFWVGTRVQYNAIKEHEKNCFYIITDDTTDTDILAMITQAMNVSNAAAADAAQALEIAIGAAGYVDAFFATTSESNLMVKVLDYCTKSATEAERVYRLLVEFAPTMSTFNFEAGIWLFEIAKSSTSAMRYIKATNGSNVISFTYDGTNQSEFEFSNPPMKAGKEYRTTERYNGKPVYVKRIELERNEVQNGGEGIVTTATYTGIPLVGTEIISMTGFACHPAYGAIDLPWIFAGTGEVQMWLFDLRQSAQATEHRILFSFREESDGVKIDMSVSELQKLDCTMKYVKV